MEFCNWILFILNCHSMFFAGYAFSYAMHVVGVAVYFLRGLMIAIDSFYFAPLFGLSWDGSFTIQNIPLGMLDEHTWDAVDKKTDDSQQSPLAGFSINCYEPRLTSKIG
ncbi:hypothetical protein ACFX2K_028606 [Malus domestica]